MRGILIISLIVLSLLSIAGAQEGLDEFDDAAGFAPPTLPQNDQDLQEVQKQLNQAVATITFLDVFSGQNISEVHIHVTLDQEGTVSQNLHYMDQTTLQIALAHEAEAIFRMDKLSTEGSDYYAQGSITPGENILHTFPVGSVQGRIISDERVVAGAHIHVDCSSNYGNFEESRSNKFGSYKREWLPVGSCTISASYEDLIGYETIEVSQGELSIVDIHLSIEKTEQDMWSKYGIYALIVFFIAIILLVSLRNKGEKPTKAQKEPTKNESNNERKSSHRTQDILTTLSPRERKVVEFIISHDNEATQGQIKNAVNIPKTTLSRILTSLEHKKILKVEKIGKMKKTRLTSFFLGNE